MAGRALFHEFGEDAGIVRFFPRRRYRGEYLLPHAAPRQ